MSAKSVLRIWLLVAGLAMLATGGCIFAPNNTEDPPDPPKPFLDPTTPNKLMENFRRAYDEMNYQEYQKVLHESFLFAPQADDLAELGLSPGEYLLRPQELAITQNFFSGKASSSGAPGITDIDIVLLEPESTWEASTISLFPEAAQEALYRVEIHFRHATGYFRVQGQQKFFVLNVPDGEKAHYYLIGQWDFTTRTP